MSTTSEKLSSLESSLEIKSIISKTITAKETSTVTTAAITNDEILPSGWTKHFSNTHKKYYYYRSSDNTRQWTSPTFPTEPQIISNNNSNINVKKRNYNEIKNVDNISNMKKKEKIQNNIQPYVAVIVPFRDLHVEQKRSQHLERFIPYMTTFFYENTSVPFRIYIIEQSDDKRKFNRGKLLNIGYDIAKKDGCEVFIFHDVDLLPSAELIKYYITKPNDNHPVHIARVWNRYSNNDKYFGGIVAFSKEQYERINGFPNNFWGWGGEDDEMFKRTEKVKLKRIGPDSGTITDLEEMTIESKLQLLRDHAKWKCMNKREVLDEHENTWQTNGISNLNYQQLSQTWKNDDCTIITVDVKDNNHWTDLVLGIEDTQLDKSIDQLKNEFKK